MRIFAFATLVASLGGVACGRSAPAADPVASGTEEGVSRSAPDGAPAAAAVGTERAARRPAWREVTIPAGTPLPIALETPISSDASRVEDRVRARLTRAISVDGVTALPADSTVVGVVTDATRSARVKGRAHVAVRFESVIAGDREEQYAIEAAPVQRTAAASKKDDALKIAAPAAGGAIVGGLIGGGKGAAIGGAAGGGAGTAVVLSTRGKEVRLGRGAALTIKLVEPLTVRVRT